MNIFSPKTVEEAVALLSDKKGQVLAGGTDLLLHLKHHPSSRPEFLVSLRAIDLLKTIQFDEKESILRIGSNVTFSEILGSNFIRENLPSLWDASQSVGSVQIRNIATVGGNLCNSSPAADTVPVLFSMNSYCVLEKKDGKRRLPVDQVLLGKGQNILEKDELLTWIEIPIPKRPYLTAFSKLGKRNALAISRAAIAMMVELESMEEPRILSCTISTGSLGVKTNHETEGAAFLIGKDLQILDGEEVAEVISKEVGLRLGNRSTAPYKREAVKGLVLECIHKVGRCFAKGGK